MFLQPSFLRGLYGGVTLVTIKTVFSAWPFGWQQEDVKE